MNKKSLFLGLALIVSVGAASLKAEDRELTLVNIKYQGKVIWLPGTIIVNKGDHVKLNLVNNVPDDPAVHGFSIPAFKVKVEVARGTPSVVVFTADKAGLFETNCQLHPGHVKGQLLVIDQK